MDEVNTKAKMKEGQLKTRLLMQTEKKFLFAFQHLIMTEELTK